MTPSDSISAQEVADSNTAAIAHVLDSIPELQRLAVSLHYHEKLSIDEVAEVMITPSANVQDLLRLALRSIHHWVPELPISAKVQAFLDAWPQSPRVEAAVAAIRDLTPGLITHLRSRKEDLRSLRPAVFEHLVGEFLVQRGISSVHLVGQDSRTSADLFAVKHIAEIGVDVRFFVEVKRWKDKVGIEVINQVVGAMILEEPEFGWHAAMIVSLGGFSTVSDHAHRAWLWLAPQSGACDSDDSLLPVPSYERCSVLVHSRQLCDNSP